MSDSLRPHAPQQARPPCPSPAPRVYPNSCPWSHWCHPIELWLFSIQIFGKQIHTWIKLVSVWKGDHKCLAWDRFPSPISWWVQTAAALQADLGPSAFRRFHFQNSLELPELWVLVNTDPSTSTGFHCFKTQKGNLGVSFLKNSPEILLQNSYLSLLLLSKFFMGKKGKGFNSVSLDTSSSHEQ